MQVLELTQIDKKLLNIIQMDFPVVQKPFASIAEKLGVDEVEVLERLATLKKEGIIRQISAIYDTRRLGYQSTLVAMKIEPSKLDGVAKFVNTHPGVSHNYGRKHAYNLWFTIAVPPGSDLKKNIKILSKVDGVINTNILPTLKLYKIGVKLDMAGDSSPTDEDAPSTTTNRDLKRADLTDSQIEIIRYTQEDVALETEPFTTIAQKLGITLDELLIELDTMQKNGVLRRYAAVLRHQKAGFTENVMAVWIVPEENIDQTAEKMASVRAVSHCYKRPIFPDWQYNIFTMIHGKSMEECEKVIETIKQRSGVTQFDKLYTTKEYKKIRLRYFTNELEEWEKTYGQ